MSTVLEIKQAIERLSHGEFRELAEWFDERKADQWDRQIEEDAKAGKLDRFAAEALREFHEGKTRRLP